MRLENNFTLNHPEVPDATFQAVQVGVITHHSCLPSLVERIIVYERKVVKLYTLICFCFFNCYSSLKM